VIEQGLWLFSKAVQLNVGALIAIGWCRLFWRTRPARSTKAAAVLLGLVGFRLLLDALTTSGTVAHLDWQAQPRLLGISLGFPWSLDQGLQGLSLWIKLGSTVWNSGSFLVYWMGRDWAGWLGILLGIWSVFSLLGFAADNLQFWRKLSNNSSPSQHDPALLVSPMFDTMAVGWLAPKVVVSSQDLHLEGAQLEAILEHERAHCRRFDPLKSWMLELLVRTFPYLLGLRWFAQQARHYFERCADQMALEKGVDRVVLARALMTKASPKTNRVWAPSARGGALYHRILDLMEPSHQAAARLWPLVWTVLIVGTHVL
jgi:Zn-dependent protease with chaperone function